MKFFQLFDPVSTSPLRLDVNPEDINHCRSALRGHGAGDILGGRQASGGGQLRDFLWATLPPVVLIAQRVESLLVEEHGSGWGVFGVSILDWSGVSIPGYLGWSIRGRCG